MPTYDLWVDFNEVVFGVTTSLERFAAPDVDLTPGNKITVGDGEGNRCIAEVIAHDPVSQFITVKCDLSTFMPGNIE